MSDSARQQIAETLLRKSTGDERVIERLVDDPEIDDEAVGFHAQQAVEKALKSILTARDIRYSRTHDLAFLLDLLQDAGIEAPVERDAVEDLTPYADRFRYEDPRAGHGLTRREVLELVRQVRAWAEGLVKS